MRRFSFAAAAIASLLLSSCGGGGDPGDPGDPAESVTFLGFSFIVAGVETTSPPLENLSTTPPTVGAPLNTTVVFKFDGIPEGPFSSATLPVRAAAADVTPEAGALQGTFVVAKGTYTQVGTTVEFMPFIPTAPLSVKLSSAPEAIPGLLPDSVYSASVSTAAGVSIGNLSGPGGSVVFGTTSNPAAFFPAGSSDFEPPASVGTTPIAGTAAFSPNPFDETPYDAATPVFPAGDELFTVDYSTVLAPTAENLDGVDLDGDDIVDPSFFVRARATRALVGGTVPASSSVGNGAEFDAISGFVPGASVAADGADVFVQNGDTLPASTDDLEGRPVGLTVGARGFSLFALYEGGTFGVIDHVVGDPSGASISTSVVVPNVEILSGGAIFPYVGDFVGLTSLMNGRVIGFEKTSRRLFEFVPEFTRSLPAGMPTLTSVVIRSDIEGNPELFRSEPLPEGFELLDLAESPNGEFFALARLSPTASPSIVRMAPIDPDLDGTFDDVDGLFLDEADDVILALSSEYAAIEFVRNGVVWALNRTLDTIDEIDLESGATTTVVSDVGAYGTSLASQEDGLSPATTLALGFAAYDVDASLLANAPGDTTIQAAPRGVLPIDRDITLMQRLTLQSLVGVSEANVSEITRSILGATEVVTVHTAAPTADGSDGSSDVVHDVFLESFLDEVFEDEFGNTLTPDAVWAATSPDGTPSGVLRASSGVSGEDAALGDFIATPLANFDAEKAFGSANSQEDANFRQIFLDTDFQNLPHPSGSTPGVTEPTTIVGGEFAFRDFIIPEGVLLRVRGSKPLKIRASGRVEIGGIIDISGVDGLGDDTFDTGFVPVPGGAGGPGAGRGGNGHPSVFDPTKTTPGVPNLNQYRTPTVAEAGYGPVLSAAGFSISPGIGGRGGISTAGYEPKNPGNPTAANYLFPKIVSNGNTEYHRPPGGGGGSFYFHGVRSPGGAGDYLVEDSFFPFSKCPTDNGIDDVLYGNDENLARGLTPNTPVQCVYRTYSPTKPGSDAGDLVFKDGDISNDYIGPGGELPFLIGGQGGGGGGTRIDSAMMSTWSNHPTLSHLGLPDPAGPPFFPALFTSVAQAPSFYDAKGGGGGGGGGGLSISALGDILITDTGHIDASGGDGNGGEEVQNSTFSGGGGGGSGGAVILQAGGEITITGEPDHLTPYWDDRDGARGAAINVSGGRGFDARTQPDDNISKKPAQREITRSDGGQGGFGLIQLQEGSGDGIPTIEQGAYLYAGVRPWLKLGDWLSDYVEPGGITQDPRRDHPSFNGNNVPPDELRYVDMLHYRGFVYDNKEEGLGNIRAEPYILLQGTYPPIVTPEPGGPNRPHQLDTKMFFYEPLQKFVVQELEPGHIFKSYAGFLPEDDYTEIDVGPFGEPGIRYSDGAVIPLSIRLKEPDGTPIMVEIDGQMSVDPMQVVDRLPVVNPELVPSPFGATSRGLSKWLDFNGAVLRDRNGDGVSPPFFDGVNGTYNGLITGTNPLNEGFVVAQSNVPGQPARYVANTPGNPFDPGLIVDGVNTGIEFNDIAVNAPELSLNDAVTNNASVTLEFQGAFPVRVGSNVIDSDTSTPWIADLSELSGYPLVRFRVTFNLSADTNFPFGAESFRPAVDYVRVRAEY